MSDMLTQAEADALLALEKHYSGNAQLLFPVGGQKLNALLYSEDKREEFLLDITSASISLSKYTFQNRARKTIVLIRVDTEGAPHRNPDDTMIPCPHIHLYKEGDSDHWAEPLSDHFNNTSDTTTILHEFIEYCHIKTKPVFVKPAIQKELFV